MGFWNKVLGPDGGKPPLTDADRDRWLEPQPPEDEPSWGPPIDGGQLPPAGVDVVEMAPGSPLGQAGIREGDLITAVNGIRTPTESSLATILGRLGPGESAAVSVTRDHSELTITVLAPS